MSSYCNQCGNGLRKSDRFCSSCGANTMQSNYKDENLPYDDSVPSKRYQASFEEEKEANDVFGDGGIEKTKGNYESGKVSNPIKYTVSKEIDHGKKKKKEDEKVSLIPKEKKTATQELDDGKKEKKHNFFVSFLKKFHIPTKWGIGSWSIWFSMCIIYITLSLIHITAFVIVCGVMVFMDGLQIASLDIFPRPAVFSIGLFPSGIFCLGVVNRCWFSIGILGIGLTQIGMVSAGLLFSIGQVSISSGFSIGQLATGFFVPISQVSLSLFNVLAQMGFSILRPFFEEKDEEGVMNMCNKPISIESCLDGDANDLFGKRY